LTDVSYKPGGDTTATALTWMSYHLTKDRDLADQLAKELSIYTTVDDLHISELEKLPLLNAFIHESLRFYPPAPIPAGRICPPQGVTIEGHFIPGGVCPFLRPSEINDQANVLHSVMSVCRDPIVFPDPDEFKLERSESRDEANDRWIGLSREEQSKLMERTMVFSYGPRICLGKE